MKNTKILKNFDPSLIEDRCIRCEKCKIEFKGLIGYVCPNLPCPVGLGCNVYYPEEETLNCYELQD